MQALLSFEQAPPFSAPLRYFLTAPLFGVLAGVLLWWSGPALLVSRWSPAALALTHLVTAGFMLQVMLGALQQLLPVVAGANIRRPQAVATVVHGLVTPGALCLVAAFLWSISALFTLAALILGIGVLVFCLASIDALRGVPATSAIGRAMRLALVGLALTVVLGVALALSLGGWFELPAILWTNIHLGWGFVGWGSALLAAVSLTIVPMFQQTPAFPQWFERGFAPACLALVALWSVAELSGWTLAATTLAGGVVLVPVILAFSTIAVQRRSKRARPDASGRLWQMAMFCTLASCVMWLAGRLVPALAQNPRWPLLIGVLVLFGVFMSVIVAMLYKIVPFLVWLHCQNRGKGRLVAPNMKKVLAQRQIDAQAIAQGGTVALLVLAVLWPPWFAYPAAVALMLSNGWLLRNLLAAVKVYRLHLAKLDALPAQVAPASRH